MRKRKLNITIDEDTRAHLESMEPEWRRAGLIRRLINDEWDIRQLNGLRDAINHLIAEYRQNGGMKGA